MDECAVLNARTPGLGFYTITSIYFVINPFEKTLCVIVVPTYMIVYCMCVPYPVFRRGHLIPWNLSYKWLLATAQVPGNKASSSVRAANDLNYWASSQLNTLYS